MYSSREQGIEHSRAVWKDHLRQYLPSNFDAGDDHHREQIIEALAAFISEKYADGPVRDELLNQAYLRALAAVGCRESSTKAFIDSHNVGDAELDCDHLCGSPYAVAELIAVGWLKPMNGHCKTPGQNWIFDLRPLAGTSSAALELAIFAELRLLIENIAVIWDSSDGAGSLAFRGLHRIMKGIYSRREQFEQMHEAIQEVISYCADLFAKAGRQRGWIEQPKISTRFV